jgi:hypothetical protein
VGPAHSLPGGVHQVFIDLTVGATYATNGNPIVLTAEGLFGVFVGLQLLRYNDGTRYWDWNGSRVAPTIKSFTAFQTETSNGTSTSGIILPAVLYMKV